MLGTRYPNSEQQPMGNENMEMICIRVKGAKVIDCDEYNDYKYVNATVYR